MLLTSEHTPCEVLFDTLKRRGGITHKDLASFILSNRPLNDGRSPLEHAKDRTWLSHVIVHAPVGAQQERYFADYGTAAVRIVNQLQSRRSRPMNAEGILQMLTGDCSEQMQRALTLCHQKASLYRNALARLAEQGGTTADERAEACMVLFVAAGCSADAQRAASYAMAYAASREDVTISTPQAFAVERPEGSSDGKGGRAADDGRTLGLVRVVDGYVSGDVHWAHNHSQGIVIGAFAMGPDDISDVDDRVSAKHLHVWQGSNGTWIAEDLGSTNGSALVDAATGKTIVLAPHKAHAIHAGDELVLAGTTTFSVIQGWA